MSVTFVAFVMVLSYIRYIYYMVGYVILSGTCDMVVNKRYHPLQRSKCHTLETSVLQNTLIYIYEASCAKTRQVPLF